MKLTDLTNGNHPAWKFANLGPAKTLETIYGSNRPVDLATLITHCKELVEDAEANTQMLKGLIKEAEQEQRIANVGQQLDEYKGFTGIELATLISDIDADCTLDDVLFIRVMREDRETLVNFCEAWDVDLEDVADKDDIVQEIINWSAEQKKPPFTIKELIDELVGARNEEEDDDETT